jgi:hypothetical protein
MIKKHDKAIQDIYLLATRLMEESLRTGDKHLGALGFSLSIYFATAAAGDLGEFVGYVMSFVDSKADGGIPVPRNLVILRQSQMN